VFSKLYQCDPERLGRGKCLDQLAPAAHERIRRAAHEERDIGTDARSDRREVQSVEPPRARQTAKYRARIARPTSESRRDGDPLAYAHVRDCWTRRRFGERAHGTRSEVVARGGTDRRRDANV